MSNPSKEEILASSRGWIASLLNFFPGLGSGYLYQRRWTPYFLTAAVAITWFSIGIIIQDGKAPSQNEQLIGISGIFLISIFTVLEANLAYKKAINKTKTEKEKTISTNKKRWFK